MELHSKAPHVDLGSGARTMILNGARLYYLAQKHVPNEPRKNDHQGRKVDEPVQCAHCMQTWPCDIKNLMDLIEELTK